MTTFNADELASQVQHPASVAERAASGLPNDDPSHITPPLDPQPVHVEPTPAIIEPEPEVLPAEIEPPTEIDPEPEVGTAIALSARFDVTQSGETWPYDKLEFQGDLLGIRLPQRQALAAFSLASSKYVADGVKNDLTGLFIARHLSPESYGRVFSRLMDPDENDYDVNTVGKLFNAIVTAAIDADKAEGSNDAK